MKKLLLYSICLLIISGCASAQSPMTDETVKAVSAPQPSTVPESDPAEVAVETSVSSEKVNVTTEIKIPEEEPVVEVVEPVQGIVFAKTDFRGVLKTHYVTLRIENQDDPDANFILHIGDKAAQKPFGWTVKTVEPGYFFIELPEGQYTMTEISIPVGSTMAVEEIKITFNVLPSGVVYMGTLRVNGTKEKIKLGGVPVIRPGFEYVLEVLDEQAEGTEAFQNRYPDIPGEITVELMDVLPLADEPKAE